MKRHLLLTFLDVLLLIKDWVLMKPVQDSVHEAEFHEVPHVHVGERLHLARGGRWKVTALHQFKVIQLPNSRIVIKSAHKYITNTISHDLQTKI